MAEGHRNGSELSDAAQSALLGETAKVKLARKKKDTPYRRSVQFVRRNAKGLIALTAAVATFGLGAGWVAGESSHSPSWNPSKVPNSTPDNRVPPSLPATESPTSTTTKKTSPVATPTGLPTPTESTNPPPPPSESATPTPSESSGPQGTPQPTP